TRRSSDLDRRLPAFGRRDLAIEPDLQRPAARIGLLVVLWNPLMRGIFGRRIDALGEAAARGRAELIAEHRVTKTLGEGAELARCRVAEAAQQQPAFSMEVVRGETAD